MNKLIIANWKMNGSLNLIDSFINEIENEEIIIAPPSVFLSYLSFKKPKFKMASQDCSIYKDFGANTGEISAKMLYDLNVRYVILGHSERRRSSALDSIDNIYKKIINALEVTLIPILCIDENYENLIDTKTKDILKNNSDSIILAYEPLSAIGTGIIPTITQIKDSVKDIKDNYFNIKTIYGGSVNKNNSKDILEIDEIDGLLIGGASLKIDELKSISSYL